MIAALAMFLVALLLAGGGIVLFLRAGAEQRQRDEQLRSRLQGTEETVGAAGFMPREAQLKNPVLRWACHLLWRSGSEVEPVTVGRILWVLLAMVPLTLVILGWFAGLFVIGVVVATGFALLTRQASARRMKIIEQLPAFLESTMRVLAAGNTLEESMAAAARESPEPLKPLFMSVGRQVRLGAPIEHVLMEVGEIHQLRDIRAMALAASVNRKFGGSLKNIIKSLIQAIRSREMSARELRALTAETRFSAVVLAVVPIGITLFIAIQNRSYYANMWADAGGRIALIVSVVMQVLGIFVLWRMMRSTEDTT
ncbi:MAG TPA: type II secretion system F family protein [Stenotrophobium sp.]|jgi:tight adherence protein B|nr:type II secretion system F family protein [Stenotrophobium sp.]